MPLKKGYSKATIAKNFKAETSKHPEMPKKQVVAIVLNVARTAAEKAGKPGKAPKAPTKGKK